MTHIRTSLPGRVLTRPSDSSASATSRHHRTQRAPVDTFEAGQTQPSLYRPTQEFYDAVNRVLGHRRMAPPGDYAHGFNTESSPNTRAAARADAARMEQALGRPLTRAEKRQLLQRQLGWGFIPIGTQGTRPR